MLAQAIAFGTQAKGVLPCPSQVGFGGIEAGPRRYFFLQFGLDGAAADEFLVAEILVAAGIDHRQLVTRRGIAPLRLARRHGIAGAGQRSIERGGSFVEIDRVHFGQ